MKNIFLISFVLLANCFTLFGQDMAEIEQTPSSQTCTLTLELTGLDSDKGQLMVGLYNSSATWLGKNFKGEIVKIEEGTATVIFTDIPYGIYAASAVHDEDSNNELNTGVFGIPSEPYASSRGAKGRFGPPKWEDAKFDLSAPELTETIKF